MTIEDMLAEGDRVATRKTFRGTHRGELLGIPPTGKPVAIGLIDMVRLEHGRVVESWSEADNLQLLQQLGAHLHPGAPGAEVGSPVNRAE
jgi:predicted ester cyclase